MLGGPHATMLVTTAIVSCKCESTQFIFYFDLLILT